MIYTDVSGRKVADPTQNSLKTELTNPVFITTQVGALLSFLLVLFTSFHFGVGVDVATNLQTVVTSIGAAGALIFEAIYARHHLGIKGLEVAAISVYKDVVPIIETLDPKITPVITKVTPIVETIPTVVGSL